MAKEDEKAKGLKDNEVGQSELMNLLAILADEFKSEAQGHMEQAKKYKHDPNTALTYMTMSGTLYSFGNCIDRALIKADS